VIAVNMDTLAVDKPWLMLGDCLERMREIPDGSVDAIICDLPYQTTACVWDTIIPFDSLWMQYRRVIKRNGAIVLTATQPFTSALVMSNPKWFKYAWIWQKERPSNFFAAKFMPLNDTEDVLVFSQGGCNNGSKSPMKYYPQGITAINRTSKNYNTGGKIGAEHRTSLNDGRLYSQVTTGYPKKIIKFNNDKNTVHPTQKPHLLFEYLILTYTKIGEVVLDNCFGSGTAGVACVNTGRRFIGVERDPHYFDVGRSRIDAAIAATQPAPQGGFFDAQEAAE
jgi:site-specific DNA-methyltransferase (adenine-specific)